MLNGIRYLQEYFYYTISISSNVLSLQGFKIHAQGSISMSLGTRFRSEIMYVNIIYMFLKLKTWELEGFITLFCIQAHKHDVTCIAPRC